MPEYRLGLRCSFCVRGGKLSYDGINLKMTLKSCVTMLLYIKTKQDQIREQDNELNVIHSKMLDRLESCQGHKSPRRERHEL